MTDPNDPHQKYRNPTYDAQVKAVSETPREWHFYESDEYHADTATESAKVFVEKSAYDAAQAEIARLKQIIVQAPNEHDDLGSEYTHVMILKDENEKLKAEIERVKIEAKGNVDVAQNYVNIIDKENHKLKQELEQAKHENQQLEEWKDRLVSRCDQLRLDNEKLDSNSSTGWLIKYQRQLEESEKLKLLAESDRRLIRELRQIFGMIQTGLTTDINKVESMTKNLAGQAIAEIDARQALEGEKK